ncbi:MAG: inorganic phosphate transporter [Candidatus Lokiarchaeota archaeon]|nr:inorganic phosphate transporter [Candidatus Lokiarchaeota archaeon]
MAVDIISIVVIVLIVLAIALAFSIGANDETLSTLVGAGVIKFKVALLIGGIAVGVGMFSFSFAFVAKTVGADLLGEAITYTEFMLLTVLISSILWLVIGSFAGIPLSSTHSLVGSIFGVVIVYSITHEAVNPETVFNWTKLNNVILGWFLSPLFGLIMTYVLFKLLAKVYLSRLKGLNQIEKSEKYFKWLLLIAVIFAEIWVGANSGEALGILYGLLDVGTLNLEQYIFFAFICGVFSCLGIFIAARYVIRNLASQMMDSRPSESLITQISSALILMIATFLSLPISHSHVIVFCIIGMSVAQRKEVDYKGLGKMAIYWVLTFPGAAILAGLIYFGFNLFGLV